MRDDAAPDLDALLAAERRAGARARRLTWAAGAVLAALLGVWAWTALAPGDRGPAYVTAEAVRGPLVVTVTATGTVEPTELVEVSSELSGTIRSVEADFNDPVTAGQPLARLDTDKLEAALAHARAALAARVARVAEARATEAEVRAQRDRVRELAERKVASAQALEGAEAAHARALAAIDVAEADVRVAEADVRSAETNLAKACICSPVDGVVLERNVDVGQTVASSFQAPVLFTIAEDLTQMELRVGVDEADMGVVRVGQPATFTVEAFHGRPFPARIAELRYAPVTVEGVVTYEAVLEIDNRDLLLRPGMTATAAITVDERAEALLVPNAALRFAPPAEAAERERASGLLGLIFRRPPMTGPDSRDRAAPDGTRTLWRVRDGAAEPVPVRTGATDGRMTEILSGDLAPGDRVAIDLLAR